MDIEQTIFDRFHEYTLPGIYPCFIHFYIIDKYIRLEFGIKVKLYLIDHSKFEKKYTNDSLIFYILEIFQDYDNFLSKEQLKRFIKIEFYETNSEEPSTFIKVDELIGLKLNELTW